MSKQQQLDQIANEIKNCKLCQKDSIGLPVFGEGNPDAKIMFIGEAPGKQEATTGRPFIGRSGKFLREQIKAIGLTEDEVYITSPVKYLPERGTPSKEQIAHARTHFLKQIEIIDPQFMVLMGKVAAWGVLNREIAVAKMHGQTLQENGKTYFFMYHPAAAIRFFKFRQTFIDDFQKLKGLLSANLSS
ncbi:MAG TPA: uracil-DNA glycosylase [Patescibacteria group bacterium]|nr:uracil-DNA glycosylase [Patescibacteria group bacterium]